MRTLMPMSGHTRRDGAWLSLHWPGWWGGRVRQYWFAMDLDEYQRGALRTAAPRDKRNELLHLVLGLVGESGEIAEKFKKWVRDLDSEESLIDRARHRQGTR